MTLEAIQFKDGKLRILDQLKLPQVTEYEEIKTAEDGWNAIKEMKVRGAPAIAMVGMLSIAVEMITNDANLTDKDKVLEYFSDKCHYICTARPTAVNIKKASDQFIGMGERLRNDTNVTVEDMKSTLITSIEKMLIDDVNDNKAIGDHGAQRIFSSSGKNRVKVLTHCNTGSLATAGYGTALGVIRSLQKMGQLEHAFCTETRPYNQGARLTSYELLYEKIPSTLICDNMVAILMAKKGIDAVVVGADRVVANGDTANKIGTYQIAIGAKYHGVPFYVAAPRTSIDLKTKCGSQIPIEERPANELKAIAGVPVAPIDMQCWNPSFDVTPASLITGGIITEIGVFQPHELEEKLTVANTISSLQ